MLNPNAQEFVSSQELTEEEANLLDKAIEKAFMESFKETDSDTETDSETDAELVKKDTVFYTLEDHYAFMARKA